MARSLKFKEIVGSYHNLFEEIKDYFCPLIFIE